jgi:hypothetical protein
MKLHRNKRKLKYFTKEEKGMKLKQIEVNNFRQLDNTVLSFQDDITLLAGLDQTTAEKLH